MALDARTRSSIYGKLTPILGDEDTNALMSEFPAAENDELVTKEFLRAELNALRTELHTEIGALRTELHTEIGALRTDLRNEFHTEISALRNELRTEYVTKVHLDSRIADLRSEITAVNAQLMDRLRQQTVFIVTALFTAVGASVGIVQVLH
ncbi:MAG: hypothetical protein N2037_08295 [Acidimicrobiales bacterium]|nr:hypothetical protein [Acidimicrobiales bacterium]